MSSSIIGMLCLIFVVRGTQYILRAIDEQEKEDLKHAKREVNERATKK